MTRALLAGVIFTLACACPGTQAQFNQPLLIGGGGGTVVSITACGSNTCNFSAGTTNPVGQAVAILSNGAAYSGAWTMPTSGTDHAGNSCPNNAADFSISSAGLLASTAASAAQQYFVCIATAGPKYVQLVTLNPGGTSCDEGPVAPRVPRGAQLAGFTHCVINADFTQNVSDGNGINFTTPSTYILACGASKVASGAVTNTIWSTIGINNSSPFFRTPLGCSRTSIITDSVSGTKALDVQYNIADYSSTIASSVNTSVVGWPTDANATASTIPGGVGCSGTFPNGCWGGPAGNGLPQNGYYQITFRITQNSYLNWSGPITNTPDWWQSGCNPNCGSGIVSRAEIDFWELGGSGINTGAQTALLQGNCHGGPCPPSPEPTVTYTNFNTSGNLMTGDGVHGYWCHYAGQNNASVGWSTPPTWSYSACGGQGSQTNNSTGGGEIMTLWVGSNSDGVQGCGAGFPVGGCEGNNFDFIITNIQLWECAAYWTSPCNGTLVSSP